MQPIKLQELKKEIAKIDNQSLVDICIRLAKHASENKQLLNYLLFHSYDNQTYIDELKQDIAHTFSFLQKSEHSQTISLRKLLLRLNKQLKFIADKNKEAEILTEFCTIFIETININSYYTSLIQILYRQFIKLCKVVEKLDEDLQFDYQTHIETIFNTLKKSQFYQNIQLV